MDSDVRRDARESEERRRPVNTRSQPKIPARFPRFPAMQKAHLLRAPFPYFGGKAKAASLVWQRFGDGLGNYVEPFFGSGAVYLNRPESFRGLAALNDLSGHVANFWRAVSADPDAVAAAADWPVNELDLQSRHQWLIDHHDDLAESLRSDPEYYDARAAGWWAWGASCWIASGWCAGGKAPCSLPNLRHSMGVHNMRRLSIVERSTWLRNWCRELQAKLRNARVACGDWRRICTPSTMTRDGVCAVFLDPPYSLTKAVYQCDGSGISADVRAWCVENGGNEKLRIALCGHTGEGHEALEALGWDVVAWHHGGYQGADDRERIWFSPACTPRQNLSLL